MVQRVRKQCAGCGKVWDIKIDKSKMEITAKMEHSSKEEADKALEILNNKEFPRSPKSLHRENELALKACYRLLSAYEKEGLPKIWIITEADRSVTTVLFPEEY